MIKKQLDERASRRKRSMQKAVTHCAVAATLFGVSSAMADQFSLNSGNITNLMAATRSSPPMFNVAFSLQGETVGAVLEPSTWALRLVSFSFVEFAGYRWKVA